MDSILPPDLPDKKQVAASLAAAPPPRSPVDTTSYDTPEQKQKKRIIISAVLAFLLLMAIVVPLVIGKINELKERAATDTEQTADDQQDENPDSTYDEDLIDEDEGDDGGRVFGCTIKAIPDATTNDLTYTLPDCASTLKLSLPASVADMIGSGGGGITGFGVHTGEYVEGMFFTRILLHRGTPIRSWADGDVLSVHSSGDNKTITIDYGRNLVGIHREVLTAYVKKGDRVEKGQEVGVGIDIGDSFSSAAFSLEDRGRDDGVSGEYGAFVSPFDYLAVDEKTELANQFKQTVLNPHVNSGSPNVGDYLFLYQPYLTNQLLVHNGNEGTISGEWYLMDTWEEGFPNDILTFFEADNPYYDGSIVLGQDNENTEEKGSSEITGTFVVDYTRHTIKMTDEGGSVYYGMFQIDDSRERAVLTIEYQNGSYPTAFSVHALEYVERDAIPREIDAEALGVLEE
jgi:hypothetical protein